MKTNKLLQALLIFSAITLSATAQVRSDKTIYIKGAKFTYPLIEKWITEFKKENPKVDIQIINKTNASQSPDLTILARKPTENEIEKGSKFAYVGRYALLPISNNRNPILNEVRKNGISKKELKLLVFEGDPFAEEQPKSKIKSKINIYTRENQACTSIALASHFGFKSSEIKSKKVTGDDNYLLNSIKKDTIGITFNNLGSIFDIHTRKLKDDFALIPLDLKSEIRAQISSSNLDQTIALLEKSNVETIPVEKFGFVVSKEQSNNYEVINFLSWILSKGQEFNHEQGFLNLTNEDLAEQKSQLEAKFLTLK